MPSLTDAASVLIEAGCRHLLVHQWPDLRHVDEQDVRDLAALPAVMQGIVTLDLGSDIRDSAIELAASTSVGALVVTPFNQHEKTTTRGWNEMDDRDALVTAARRLSGRAHLIVFVDPRPEIIRMVADTGATGVELNCRTFARAHAASEPETDAALVQLRAATVAARDCGLRVRFAHDLGLSHVGLLAPLLPDRITVGHAFIADALIAGLGSTFTRYGGEIVPHPAGLR